MEFVGTKQVGDFSVQQNHLCSCSWTFSSRWIKENNIWRLAQALCSTFSSCCFISMVSIDRMQADFPLLSGHVSSAVRDFKDTCYAICFLILLQTNPPVVFRAASTDDSSRDDPKLKLASFSPFCCSFPAQIWVKNNLVSRAHKGRAGSGNEIWPPARLRMLRFSTNETAIWNALSQIPSFPFRWTRVTRALGTRLNFQRRMWKTWGNLS